MSVFKRLRTTLATYVPGLGAAESDDGLDPPPGDDDVYKRFGNKSIGVWCPDLGMAKLLRTRGKQLRTMGVSIDGSVCLFGEEALYLCERALLVLRWGRPVAGGGAPRPLLATCHWHGHRGEGRVLLWDAACLRGAAPVAPARRLEGFRGKVECLHFCIVAHDEDCDERASGAVPRGTRRQSSKRARSLGSRSIAATTTEASVQFVAPRSVKATTISVPRASAPSAQISGRAENLGGKGRDAATTRVSERRRVSSSLFSSFVKRE